MINHIAVEGIDRIGKSTLINNIVSEFELFQIRKFSKPEINSKHKTFLSYQQESFTDVMKEIKKTKDNLLFDRFTLGEMVYSPLYRNYSGDYVCDLEIEYNIQKDVLLVLLITSNFNLLIDDNKSFNFNNKVIEQELFLKAFNQSNIKNKIIINVSDNNKFKKPENIYYEFMNFYCLVAK